MTSGSPGAGHASFGSRAEAVRQSGFNPHVHGARGLFSLMVFIFHVANSGLPTFGWAQHQVVHVALLSFRFGVELFFGISGIVIIGALARSPGAGAFVWDRATRILPVLWTSIAVITILAFVSHQPLPAQTVGHWIGNILPAPPFFLVPLVNPPAWSLGYELTFYLLAALAWRWRAQPVACVLMWMLGIVMVVAFPRAVLMIPGVLIALRLLDGRRVAGLDRWPGLWLILFLAFWSAAFAIENDDWTALNIFGPFYVPFATWAKAVPFLAIGGTCGILTLTGIAEGRGLLGRMLTTKPMLWLGTVSYSFYLWHPLVLAITKRVLGALGLVTLSGAAAQVLLFVVALPAVLVVSWISQRILEARLTRWLRRFGPKKPVGPVERVAAATSGGVA